MLPRRGNHCVLHIGPTPPKGTHGRVCVCVCACVCVRACMYVCVERGYSRVCVYVKQ